MGFGSFDVLILGFGGAEVMKGLKQARMMMKDQSESEETGGGNVNDEVSEFNSVGHFSLYTIPIIPGTIESYVVHF